MHIKDSKGTLRMETGLCDRLCSMAYEMHALLVHQILTAAYMLTEALYEAERNPT